MTRLSRSLALLSAVVAIGGLAPTPATASHVQVHTMRLWTYPPVDSWGNNACLTRGWHGGDADPYANDGLDWKATCGANGSEPVYLRVAGADINEHYGTGIYEGMHAEAVNFTVGDCPGNSAWTNSVHIGKVKLYSFFNDIYGSGFLMGHLLYGHVLFDYQGDIPIYYIRGGTQSNAWFTSENIGDTKNNGVDWNPIDGVKDFTNCWQGWHAHENNSVDSQMKWDKWNGPPTQQNPNLVYPNAPTGGTYQNNSYANWSRRMEWTWVPAT